MSNTFQSDSAEPNIRLRCAFYGRNATDTAQRASIEDQLRTCTEFADSRGWEIDEDHIYGDVGFSGTKEVDRVGLEALKGAVEETPWPFDCILVEETSRLARNQASILNFVRTMGHYGIRVCFVSQCLNSSDENFALILSAFSMTDQMYVDRLRVKVLSGQKERVLRGFHAGIVPYGYRMVPVHNTADPTAVGRAAALGCKLEVVEEQAAIVRRIFQQFVDGNGVVAIGRQLNAEKIPPPGSVRAGRRNAEWSRGTVRRILRNSTFRGEILWNTSGRCRHPLTGAVKQLIKPEHEHVRIAAEHLRIVDDEIWFKAAEKLRLLEHKAQVV